MTSVSSGPKRAAQRIAAAGVRIAALVVTASVLSGCYSPREVTDTIPNDYRKRHPITIQEGERTVSLFVGDRRGTLTPVQRVETTALASAWKREATGGIIIDVPKGGNNERSAAEAAREAQSLLFAAGVPAHVVRLAPYAVADLKFAPVKITYTRVMADAGPCGLWPKDLGPDADPIYKENRPYWNLGCSNQRNLAAMVDNPADLVQPRSETPAYTPRRTVVLDKYTNGESTATQYPDKDSGKVSDVGK